MFSLIGLPADDNRTLVRSMPWGLLLSPIRGQGIFLSCLLWLLSCSALFSQQRPHIVLILCDDMGYSDLGCYGGEIETPNLDALASSGVRFVDFHNNAKCSETRASLLTGLWHHQTKLLRADGNVTLAEVLRRAGYRTYMSGKWHLHGHPMDRGFQRFFGFLGGAINYFTGTDWQKQENMMRLGRQVYLPPPDFYSTDAITDYALQFLREDSQFEEPFFLYLAYNAPHFPLHALPEDIAKYRSAYDSGWDVIRQQRWQRMQNLGIAAGESWTLSQRDPQVEPWETLNQEQRAFLVPMMEVYAAMVDRLDQNIGRLVAFLEQRGQLDNTLLIFLSDNGACPYWRIRSEELRPGGPDSDIAYDARWANMCNTPLRLYKQYAHEGGTATPLIVHWPQGMSTTGAISRFPGHIVDIMPTLLEVAQADYPEQIDGQEVWPLVGQSLLPALQDPQLAHRAPPMFWEFNGNHGVRSGDWKLVAARSGDWELYHLAADRCETQNRAAEFPQRVAELAAAYDEWARTHGARSHRACRSMKPSSQGQLMDLQQWVQRAANKSP
ncbi:MAG: hypothetical protein KatS3mg111_3651 [Pirellulaceae bacterium]|nr:MAG: hypothetical protein KatS3mg111_3651 [Pirellulaceae bacterium]